MKKTYSASHIELVENPMMPEDLNKVRASMQNDIDNDRRHIKTQMSIKKSSLQSQAQIKKTIKNNSKKNVAAAMIAVLLAASISTGVCLVVVSTRTMGGAGHTIQDKNGDVLGTAETFFDLDILSLPKLGDPAIYEQVQHLALYCGDALEGFAVTGYTWKDSQSMTFFTSRDTLVKIFEGGSDEKKTMRITTFHKDRSTQCSVEPPIKVAEGRRLAKKAPLPRGKARARVRVTKAPVVDKDETADDVAKDCSCKKEVAKKRRLASDETVTTTTEVCTCKKGTGTSGASGASATNTTSITYPPPPTTEEWQPSGSYSSEMPVNELLQNLANQQTMTVDDLLEYLADQPDSTQMSVADLLVHLANQPDSAPMSVAELLVYLADQPQSWSSETTVDELLQYLANQQPPPAGSQTTVEELLEYLANQPSQSTFAPTSVADLLIYLANQPNSGQLTVVQLLAYLASQAVPLRTCNSLGFADHHTAPSPGEKCTTSDMGNIGISMVCHPWNCVKGGQFAAHFNGSTTVVDCCNMEGAAPGSGCGLKMDWDGQQCCEARRKVSKISTSCGPVVFAELVFFFMTHVSLFFPQISIAEGGLGPGCCYYGHDRTLDSSPQHIYLTDYQVDEECYSDSVASSQESCDNYNAGAENNLQSPDDGENVAHVRCQWHSLGNSLTSFPQVGPEHSPGSPQFDNLGCTGTTEPCIKPYLYQGFWKRKGMYAKQTYNYNGWSK